MMGYDVAALHACSGGSLVGAFARTMQLGGAQALVLRLLLGRMSGRLSAQVRRHPLSLREETHKGYCSWSHGGKPCPMLYTYILCQVMCRRIPSFCLYELPR